MQINFVNWPAALVTIVFRRFVDSQFLNAPRALTKGPWVIADVMKPGIFYVYCFGALVTYIAKHINRGTIVNMASTCSNTAVSLRDKYLQKKRWLKRNRSWVLQNLLSTRNNQGRALSYLASMSNEDLSKGMKEYSNRRMPEYGRSTPNLCNSQTSPTNICQKRSQTAYYSVIDHPINRKLYTSKVSESMQDAINMKIRNYKEEYGRERERERPVSIISSLNKSEGKDSVYASASASEECSASLMLDLYTPSIIEEILPSENSGDENDDKQFIYNRNYNRKPQRKRSKLVNINKKVMRRDNKLVRKTRSGKIYGYKDGRRKYSVTKT